VGFVNPDGSESLFGGASVTSEATTRAAADTAQAAAIAAVPQLFGYTTLAVTGTPPSLINDTATAIIWDGATHDPLSTWSAGDPTKIIIPAGATHMIPFCHVEWPVNSVGYRSLRMFINGAATASPYYSATDVRTANGVIPDHQNVNAGIMPVTPGDAITFMARQNSTSTLVLVGTSIRVNIQWLKASAL
jgi:hypothetical protein